MGATRRFRGIVAVGLLLTIVSTATAKYSGGKGEPNDPYQIATAADLIALGETPADYDKHFLLTADIDLDPNLPGRKVFDRAVIAPDTDPVTSDFQGTGFSGVFDGHGHTISHLTIKGADCLGLFGLLDWAWPDAVGEVRSLGVVDVNIIGSSCVGGLAGANGYCTVTGCYVTGTVSGNDDVGGLVGSNLGTVTQCHSTAAVKGRSWVGGLAGFNGLNISESHSTGAVSGYGFVGGLVGSNEEASYIAHCYSTGVVSGTDYVGGLVGLNCGHVSQCYSTGTVRGKRYVGGLVGLNGQDGGPGQTEAGWISNCYSGGEVSGESAVGGLLGDNQTGEVVFCYSTGLVTGKSDVGGLVGTCRKGWFSPPVVTGSFWDTQTSGQTVSAGAIAKTTAEMKKASTYFGWGGAGTKGSGLSMREMTTPTWLGKVSPVVQLPLRSCQT